MNIISWGQIIRITLTKLFFRCNAEDGLVSGFVDVLINRHGYNIDKIVIIFHSDVLCK